jgi:hypothetical protein
VKVDRLFQMEFGAPGDMGVTRVTVRSIDEFDAAVDRVARLAHGRA